MKAVVFILAIVAIYSALPPTFQTHRYEVPKEQRKEIFEELGLKFNETLDEFCDEVKKVLEPKAGIVVSNATELSSEDNKNFTKTVSYKKCLTKDQEEKKLFEHGFACIQKSERKTDGTYNYDPANCTKLEYRLDCCNKTVTAECQEYFDDFSSFKCAFCFSQGLPHPCNVLDEYKDLYYEAKNKVKDVVEDFFNKTIFNKTFFNNTKIEINWPGKDEIDPGMSYNGSIHETYEEEIEIDPGMSYDPTQEQNGEDEIDPGMSYDPRQDQKQDQATKQNTTEEIDPEFSV